MSPIELKRIEIIGKVVEKRLKQIEASKLLSLTTRQIIRLTRQYRQHGKESLISKRRGKPSNRQHKDEFKAEIRNLIQKNYSDFGPSFAGEKLFEKHQKIINKETLRQWMAEWGFWEIKIKKIKKLYQTRDRRTRFGELVQIDGSPHDWFEGRRKKCCLLVFIDDATSKLLGLRFEETECSSGYFKLCQETIKKHGRPLAYYSDKWSGFRQNLGGQKDTLTQFGRVLEDLDIDLICANSPQAKGRVERANQTLQDRLVKELRLRKINDIESANIYLHDFIEEYNKKFAVEAFNGEDAHRKDLPNEETQAMVFSFQTERVISKQLEIFYKNRLLQIQNCGKGYQLQHKKILVCESTGGEIYLLFNGKKLDFTEHIRNIKTPQILDRKALNHVLDALDEKKKNIPAPNHPWKKYVTTTANQTSIP